MARCRYRTEPLPDRFVSLSERRFSIPGRRYTRRAYQVDIADQTAKVATETSIAKTYPEHQQDDAIAYAANLAKSLGLPVVIWPTSISADRITNGVEVIHA